MRQRSATYQIAPYPKARRAASVAMRAFQRKPMMHGLIEVDVTRARALLRDHKARTGESLSFTAYLVTCLGKALDEYKFMQAYRWGRKRLVIFDEVDVAIIIERDVAGEKIPLIYVLRDVNHKTYRQIHQAIQACKTRPVTRSVLGFAGAPFLPTALLTGVLYRLLRTIPWLHKRVVGTVGVTSVGMFGQGGGWGIPVAGATLAMTLGGLTEKPRIIEGRLASREYLCVTLSFDHRIIDGAPAARFTSRLNQLIESGYGLDDLAAESRGHVEVEGSAETVRAQAPIGV